MNAVKLVLLPGLDGTGVLFRPLLAALPQHIEPLVIPYPTHEPLGYRQLIERVEPQLPQDAPYLLLGESFGGPLSLQLAARRPRWLEGVILCGSFIACPFGAIPHWVEPVLQPLPFQFFPLYARLQVRMTRGNARHHAELAREALTQVSPAVLAHRAREILKVNVSAELQACAVPLLYIQGVRDRVVRAANLSRIRQLRPDLHTVRIDTSHMILKRRPYDAARAIDEFARRCRSTP